ncbi:MAG: hypothetical protein UY02_C0033G0002 [Candidatus Giovannonibacteria bacterium GW2011_GWB1_47_6b]|uniref:Uncharacterized protein n=1 Tax=Candidatus Giovannonibacteria bacterium GW2011_GWB1_47_6b TaxID=1618655 RepID=A0A0G1W1A3_9BACT|nr:MAG: hypothetical protein UY02_C0033G0002 [Candidatus Giovannonibacteria bacterium GW2011_GWB1_47_6b]
MEVPIKKGHKRFHLNGQIDTFIYQSYVDAKDRLGAVDYYYTKHHMTAGGNLSRGWINQHLTEEK